MSKDVGIVFEGMRKITTTSFVVRLWLRTGDPTVIGWDRANENLDELKRQVAYVIEKFSYFHGCEIVLAKQIADRVANVNAVEVLNHGGEGGLVYPDWP